MDIQSAVKLAKMATGRNLPAYENIAIVNGEKMISTNGMIRMEIDVDIGGIDCVVDGSKLSASIGKFKSPSFEHSENKLTIKEGRSRASIPSTPSSEFPAFMESTNNTQAPAELITAIKRVAFAAADGDVRGYLNGVHVGSIGGKSVAVATTGHHLAFAKIDALCEYRSAIIPIQAISAIDAIKPSSIDIGTKIVLNGDGVELTVNPIDGKYPDWERVIPVTKQTLTVDRASLLDALGKVSIVSNDKMQAGMMSITKDSITISTRHSESEAQAMIDCDATVDMDIGVNIRYLIDATNAIEGDTVTIKYDDPLKAIMFESDSLSVVVMPMRV